MNIENINIAVIGQGYVGLPLAVEFGKKFKTIGFDINLSRIAELNSGLDSTLEVSSDELSESKNITFSSNVEDIHCCNVYIVTVPTPIDRFKKPDLTPLIKASEMLGKVVSKDDVIIYESTVYPGATEDDCIPVVERISGMTFNKDFFAGYSPERINPGDKTNRVTNIKKVTSGSTPEVANFVNDLYSSIIVAGTHKASSIKIAEASKVIENTQRDLNIALVNELAIIFNKLDIDTLEVLEAAGTKWNFLPFRPGLVGGHCIGVDPYYLTHKSQSVGYMPDVILSGRKINDGMGGYVASQLIKEMIKKRLHIMGSKVLVLGLTFKENCPDIRNTRVVDIISDLKSYDMNVDIYDPWCDANEVKTAYELDLIDKPSLVGYDAILCAVAHEEFKTLFKCEFKSICKKSTVVYDLKYILPKELVDLRL
jgi:UDP-N-acetyl-D-galactosamine dehydrogenase